MFQQVSNLLPSTPLSKLSLLSTFEQRKPGQTNRSNTNMSFMRGSKGAASALRYEGFGLNDHFSLHDKSSLGHNSIEDLNSNQGGGVAGDGVTPLRERGVGSNTAMKVENRNMSVL